MGATRTAGWVGGTVVLVLAILAAGWFVFAAPRFEDAAATLLEAQDTQDRNLVLSSQVASLRADFNRLEEYRAELAALSLQIPAEERLADLTQMLEQIRVETGVTYSEVAPGAATFVIPVTVPELVEVPTEPVEGVVETPAEPDEEAPGSPEPTTPTAPAEIDGFAAVPISIKAVGGYANILDYLDRVQALERLFLVTTWDATRQVDAEPAQGQPATVDGDLEIQIQGFVYVLLPPPTGELDEDVPTVTPPLPATDRNPFVPLVPSGAGQ